MGFTLLLRCAGGVRGENGAPPSENTPDETLPAEKTGSKPRPQKTAREQALAWPGWLSEQSLGPSNPRKQRQALLQLSGLLTPVLKGQAWPGPRLVAGPGTGDIMPQAPAPEPRHLSQIRFSFLITAVMGPSDLIPALDII